ncbi:unnamed protein product [Acanthoscelides obtectus]|uniref:Uncharacterized protein n=1 Tax=Acanthoscelides obtectus TaxID=200917 RepID=A0A9P0M219_ACAOB|nr:unnamed protein product [Acanthoscelides obtectus]CAK1658534.1 hypothetical protein AOBTE_LOCUS20966 [Acanthoscelides obtectus]
MKKRHENSEDSAGHCDCNSYMNSMRSREFEELVLRTPKSANDGTKVTERNNGNINDGFFEHVKAAKRTTQPNIKKDFKESSASARKRGMRTVKIQQSIVGCNSYMNSMRKQYKRMKKRHEKSEYSAEHCDCNSYMNSMRNLRPVVVESFPTLLLGKMKNLDTRKDFIFRSKRTQPLEVEYQASKNQDEILGSKCLNIGKFGNNENKASSIPSPPHLVNRRDSHQVQKKTTDKYPIQDEKSRISSSGMRTDTEVRIQNRST